MQSTKRLLPLMLALLLTSLTGCATNSPSPVQQAKIPLPPPEIMEPEDLSESYSEIVRKLFKEWRGKLTDWRQKL